MACLFKAGSSGHSHATVTPGLQSPRESDFKRIFWALLVTTVFTTPPGGVLASLMI